MGVVLESSLSPRWLGNILHVADTWLPLLPLHGTWCWLTWHQWQPYFIFPQLKTMLHCSTGGKGQTKSLRNQQCLGEFSCLILLCTIWEARKGSLCVVPSLGCKWHCKRATPFLYGCSNVIETGPCRDATDFQVRRVHLGNWQGMTLTVPRGQKYPQCRSK